MAFMVEMLFYSLESLAVIIKDDLNGILQPHSLAMIDITSRASFINILKYFWEDGN